MTPCLSLLEHDAGALEGAPNTLGYPSPEVTALGHSQQPSSPLDLHKDDLWAVGVMGLLWLSKRQTMPFGPTRQQAKRLATPHGLAEAKKSVLTQHDAWVSLTSFVASQLTLPKMKKALCLYLFQLHSLVALSLQKGFQAKL